MDADADRAVEGSFKLELGAERVSLKMLLASSYRLLHHVPGANPSLTRSDC